MVSEINTKFEMETDVKYGVYDRGNNCRYIEGCSRNEEDGEVRMENEK